MSVPVRVVIDTERPEVAAESEARIGPNAIIQTGHVLRTYGGEGLEAAVFLRAGLSRYLRHPPARMIPEREAQALFRVLYREAGLSREAADAIAQDAGARTGDYILANRIPLPVQGVLKLMPRALAARVLLKAISKHAWTFAGSGQVTCSYGRSLTIEIADNPLAEPGCAWHRSVFERLFGVLITERVTVRHTACCANGDPACRFEIGI